VKCAPLESYVGFPDAVNDSTEPFVKSTLIAFPKAVFAGQLAVNLLA
jgi:hypothetical protein